MAKNNDVDLYNPKFVHFEWSEDLKDKEGFYGDLIDELRADVRNNGMIGVCDRLGDPGFPFHIKDDGIYRFFYYDPNYNIKWAYFKEGKVIQIRREGCEWFDVRGHYDPEFFDNDDDRYEFRIKPEEEKPEVEVNVDVNINNAASNGKIKITINGKECIFENAEQAKMVLNSSGGCYGCVLSD